MAKARHGKAENSGARSRSEGLQLDEDASSEDEWRELKNEVADASQAHLGRPRRHSEDRVTDEAIAWAEQACLARIESVPKYRDLRKRIKRPPGRDHNANGKTIATESKRAVACGNTRKLHLLHFERLN